MDSLNKYDSYDRYDRYDIDISDIKHYIKYKELPGFDETILKKKNYIMTENSIEKINKISYYISRGVPVLLEGPSGTSKTFSTEMACLASKTKRPLIRFNISSDITIADLLGKMTGDKKSIAGISWQEGPFFKSI